MRKIPKTLRGHLLILLGLAALIVVMTFPTAARVFDSDTFWIPTGDQADAWMKFWDAWYAGLVLRGEADMQRTDLLFYPQGLSLTFHNFSIAHMLLLGGLGSFMPASNAFNLVFLLIIFGVSCASYLYFHYLFKDKWIALLSTIVFSMSPFVLGHAQHPDVGFIATIPLSLYFLHRGLLESRHRLVALSAAITGITAYIGLYIFVCLCITVFMYMLYFAAAHWRDRRFQVSSALFILLALACSLPRIYPMLQSREAFADAMQKTLGPGRGSDVVEYFVNVRHPILEPVYHQLFQLEDAGLELLNTSYLGYTVLILIIAGLALPRYRRLMVPWLILICPFLLLRLGSILTIGGRQHPNIPLPKRFLDALVPGVFEGFHTSDHFQMGVLLPLAVLAGYGVLALRHRLSARHRPALALICMALIACEYYQPIEARIVPKEQLAFLETLNGEPGSIRIINAPFGRGNSKNYLLYQTFNGFPQVEGLISRTPASAYDYIDANPILSEWRRNRDVFCSDEYMDGFEVSVDIFLEAIDDLENDGFSHVVFHPNLGHGFSIRKSFEAAEPIYSDAYVSIYRLSNLRASCPGRA
ncbi:MAG: hypothetical protein OXG85_02820 [Chloroflexi bacterium]|nr:hypothetical protein [Chloroflexota bacterium]